MNILFVTYGELSLEGALLRPVSILRALADAGHHVDVIARKTMLPEHPLIHSLAGDQGKPVSRQKIRVAALKATGKKQYDVLHAIDATVLFLNKISRLRKSRLVYDASRRFSGDVGEPPSGLWKLMPGYLGRMEKRALERADAVLTSCPTLTNDLKGFKGDAAITQIEDIPAQSLFAGRDIERSRLLNRFDGKISSVVVCSLLPGKQNELRKLLMGVRKVIEAIPEASFFFKGTLTAEAENMAANLDIQKRCSFFKPNETREFLSALDIADVTLLVPGDSGRYVHGEVFTLLNSQAPLVVVQNTAYETILSDKNSIQVLSSSDAIAEGLLRAIQEPLFSLALAVEGQQLIADRYSLSSFKHKIRMTYHKVLSGE